MGNIKKGALAEHIASSTADPSTIISVLAIAASTRRSVETWDVISAYLLAVRNPEAIPVVLHLVTHVDNLNVSHSSALHRNQLLQTRAIWQTEGQIRFGYDIPRDAFTPR